MITGNKGEWSEIYTFFKLLGDGGIYAADGNLNKIESRYYPLIEILRTENGQTPKRYINDTNQEKIKIIDAKTNECLVHLPIDNFIIQSKLLLEKIKSKKNKEKGAFSVIDTENFMNKIYCKCLKAPAPDKSDITLVLHDTDTYANEQFGFSIKSKLGNPSTLVNPSGQTIFSYEVIGNLSPSDIEEINEISSKSKIIDRINMIFDKGCKFRFEETGKIFQLNLEMVDVMLPQIISFMLLHSYKRYNEKCIKDINKLIEILDVENPCNFDMSKGHPFYSYKIKSFLVAYALGMKANTVWNGEVEATGGYIVVKQDGDLACYHFYRKNEFSEYLLNNTRLETPNGRADFGKIYCKNGKNYIALNLQVRFI